ncbi:MAG: transporter substrate-binding domain-containing protein [Lunatimonas sp.]|uniref:transporter substrate-binding domain-containing protein n=1 Tax=Lunatimonas sp. TaxID=2060141 RepID=UPI00263B7DF6|nr:transporter substrate-binding domain-containing protein [Lunatimonas sp.]MCC5937817.1 transporter substrate-binding domain-containing protein [Lunatimonas sp.]
MKKHTWHVFVFGILVFFLPACNNSQPAESDFWDNPVEIDFDAIKERGFIRVVVDNSSTSYYVYRGRTMGYEFELLRNLSSRLGLGLHLVISNGLEESFRFLNEGKADLIAINFELSEEREKYAAFTQPINEISTILVQRKREDLITSFEELREAEMHIKRGTIYKDKLSALSDSLALGMDIVENDESLESLIMKVVEGDIPHTVVDEDIALVNATYYDELDVSFAVSSPSQVAWAVRKNAPQLLEKVNEWIARIHKTGYQAVLYQKYFLNKKNSYFRSSSAFSSVSGGRISAFDELIKEGADMLGWDWRLLASLVYKESRFDTTAVSYAGAVGLLQLMPVTLRQFGVTNPNDPRESLRGGVNYLRYLDGFWLERIPDNNERIRFILASYNIGHGHVQDAWRLALKFGKDSRLWSSAAFYLERKSKPEVYRDPLVTSGYAKGHLAVQYVTDIMSLYESYKVLVSP